MAQSSARANDQVIDMSSNSFNIGSPNEKSKRIMFRDIPRWASSLRQMDFTSPTGKNPLCVNPAGADEA